MTGVRDLKGHEFDDDSSQSARLVKPTMTPSIQYCERTACRSFSVEGERAVVGQHQGGHVAETTNATCQYHVPFAPISV